MWENWLSSGGELCVNGGKAMVGGRDDGMVMIAAARLPLEGFW